MASSTISRAMDIVVKSIENNNVLVLDRNNGLHVPTADIGQELKVNVGANITCEATTINFANSTINFAGAVINNLTGNIGGNVAFTGNVIFDSVTAPKFNGGLFTGNIIAQSVVANAFTGPLTGDTFGTVHTSQIVAPGSGIALTGGTLTGSMAGSFAGASSGTFSGTSTGSFSGNVALSTLVPVFPSTQIDVLSDLVIQSGSFLLGDAVLNTLTVGTVDATVPGGPIQINGVPVFQFAPTLPTLTASLPLFTDSLKSITTRPVTGTGSVVLASNPVLISPNLGTPTVLAGTNITGTAPLLTSGTCTNIPSLSGDVTNIMNTITLQPTGVIAETYGSATEIPVLTIDAKGRITSAHTESASLSFLGSPLDAGNIILGNIDGIASSVTITGVVSLDDLGVTTLNALSVTNGMLAGSIDLTTKVTNVLPVMHGGSGASTLTGVIKGTGTTAFAPATSSDILSTLGNQNQRTVLAGPVSGAAAQSSFRLLQVTDIPSGVSPLGSSLAVANIIVGGPGATATSVAMSGDIAITSSGATTIQPLSVTNAKLAGGIDLTSKVINVLPVNNGGSGASTLTGILVGNGILPFSAAAASDIDNTFGSQSANSVYASPNGSAGTPSFRALASDDIPTLDQLKISSTSGFTGQATLVGGTVTVANTNLTVADTVFITRVDLNASTALGFILTTVLPGVSFTVTSYQNDAVTVEAGDTSIVGFMVVRAV